MSKLLGKSTGFILYIIMIPIALILAIPIAIIKVKKDRKNRLLFTGREQALLGKAQSLIDFDSTSAIKFDTDLVNVAKCIENARCDYQKIKSRERFDASFSEFVLPKIQECYVSDWDNVMSYYELSHFINSETHSKSASVRELIGVLQNHIAEYSDKNGVYPNTIMLDKNIYMMFELAGVFKDGSDYFGKTVMIPVSNIDGGFTWKLSEPIFKDTEIVDADDIDWEQPFDLDDIGWNEPFDIDDVDLENITFKESDFEDGSPNDDK